MSLTQLTPAENKIAKNVAMGFSEKEIADRLCLSEHTVHNHTYNIRKKIKARSAVDICRMFILSLDNPKQFFTCLLFLTIQGHIIFAYPAMELRKPVKTVNRIVRTSRKNKD
ncbi:helix-turn-helix transcriptional regulator [uncultured Christiangramia sp.]|uniref:helix-turn-helix transcriptional regulator n=1 Tax=uncultured Christiangramia sp. TaxID=503836 RepID=UPI0026202D81|nr:helix-turn-helix transcriptional regulator [uncultured Christiangramia sp.]